MMNSSNHPYSAYSSTTPRPNSSTHIIDKNPHALSHQGKLQSWADAKIPTTKSTKSPTKTSVKSPKSQIDSQLKDILAAKGQRKPQYSAKENTQKSISPTKKNLQKRSIDSQNHPILINNYEIDTNRLAQLQTLALQQEFLSQPVYGAEFAEWVARKTAHSTKNAADKSLRMSEQFHHYNQTEERQRQNSTHDLHKNVWPESQKLQKGEIYSHRQHLEASVDANKTGKKQLTLSPNSAQKRGVKSILSSSTTKPATPKGNPVTHSLKVSPRNADLNPLRGSYDVQAAKKFEFPKTTKNETSKPRNNFFQEESPVKLKKKKLIKSPGKKKSKQDVEITEWLRTAKKSNPNVLNDINSYMQLVMHQRGSEPEIHDYAYPQQDKEQYALSTRSAADRYENNRGQNVQHPTEEDDGQQPSQQIRSSVKTIYSSLKSPKEQQEPVRKSRLDQSPQTREIVNELLKRTNSKDLIINPNAKFMALRKQIHEKRTKATFKSADWGLPGAQNNQRDLTEDQQYRPEPDYSPERNTKARNLSGNTKSMEGAPVKAQLDLILNKTKQILGTYRYRENTWDKEKKALVNEILHLRSVIENP